MMHISDYDAHFLNTFCKMLWSLLGFHLKYSMAFHPQIDGLIEVVNHNPVHNMLYKLMRTQHILIF